MKPQHAPAYGPFAAAFLLAGPLLAAAKIAPRVETKHDEKAGKLVVTIDGKQALLYRYGDGVDLPHYVPHSPSGKPMTVVRTNPYPHHRSFWFADKVQRAGQRVAKFYNALYSRADKEDPNSPFNDRIRHVRLEPPRITPGRVALVKKLLWEIDRKAPVLDETRRLTVTALGGGEYLLDVTFTVTASYGDVAFVSDSVHYAWPYLRMTPAFSVKGGGTMTNSEGGVNQKGTHGKVATWVDYSNTIGGVTEGLAVFSHTDNKHPHAWLTRDYGTFGPRRINARSGKRFTLEKGTSLSRRIGVLVHRGDVKTGKVAERYEAYVKGAP